MFIKELNETRTGWVREKVALDLSLPYRQQFLLHRRSARRFS